VSDQHNDLFGKIKQKTNIDPQDVFKVADSVKGADFSDEETVRNLVRQLAKLANKPISKQKEDKIVEAVTNNNMPMDLNSLNRLFKNT